MPFAIGDRVTIDLNKLGSVSAGGVVTGRVFQTPGEGRYDVLPDEPIGEVAVLSWAPEEALQLLEA